MASVGVKTFEEDVALLGAAEELAKKLREAVIGRIHLATKLRMFWALIPFPLVPLGIHGVVPAIETD